MSRPPVVLVGLDCPTGLQASRIFAARGVSVIGLASDVRHPCARTRSCRDLVEVPRDPEGLAQALLELGKRRDERAVLVPCTDLAVLGVARHLDELSKHYHAAMPRPEVTEMLLDKARFAEFATVNALPIPATYVIRSAQDLEVAASAIGYPCVFKPAVKSPSWGSAVTSKALIAESKTALREIYQRHHRLAEAFLAQEWIPGGDEDHVTCDCYIDRSGRPLVTFCTRKLRQWPPGIGQGCLSIEHRDDILRETAIRMFEAAGHRGQGYLEMKRDPTTGRHLIIEANVGRPTGRSAAAERAGVELLMTLYCDLAGLPLPREREQRFHGTKWIHVRRDLQASATLLVRGRVGVRDVLRSWKAPLAFALWSRSDPVPFLADWAHAVATVPRSVLRRAFGRVATSRGSGETERPPGTSRASRTEPEAPRDGDRPARRAPPSSPRDSVVDFAVSGAVVIRTVDAGPEDVRAVTRELGPVRGPRRADPDILICFVDELTQPPRGRDPDARTVFGNGGVYCFDAGDPEPVAHVRMGDEWGRTVVVCRRGLGRVPALSTAIDLAALSHGWIPLHASAWVMDGKGVLAAGGAGSGKTGALLSGCLNGATPLGDDRVLLSATGEEMVGLGDSMSLRDWHLSQPESRDLPVSRARRGVAKLGTLVGRLSRSAMPRLAGWPHRLPRFLRRVVSGARRRIGIEVPLERAGRRDRTPHRPSLVLLLETRDQSEIVAEPLDGCAAASRLARDVEEELMPALRRLTPVGEASVSGWEGVEHVPRVAARLLQRAIRDLPTFRLTHPPECSLAVLHEVIAGLLASTGPDAEATVDVTSSRARWGSAASQTN